jgi:hypothetical protein
MSASALGENSKAGYRVSYERPGPLLPDPFYIMEHLAILVPQGAQARDWDSCDVYLRSQDFADVCTEW